MFEFIKNLSYEKFFVFVSLIIGLLYVFILPPFQSVDEGAHFFRTIQISEGKLISKNIGGQVGDFLPVSCEKFYNNYFSFIKNIDKKTNVNEFKNNFSLPLNNEEKAFIQFANTSLYSPVCYISQLPGVFLGKILNLPLGFIYYFGRLCNLFVYIFLCYFAIKFIPFYKAPLTIIAMLPMSLSLAASYTSDVAVFCLNFFWVAYILKLLSSDNFVREKDVFLLSLLAFLITLTKSYLLLIPLIFLIPKSKFKSLNKYLLCIFSVLSCVVVSGLIWYFCSKGLTLNMNGEISNSAEQFLFIKTHPFYYIFIFFKSLIIKFPRLIITMIGVLGWQDAKLDYLTYFIYPFLVYFAIYSDIFNFSLKNWQKYLILLFTFVGVFLTFTSLYVMWTPVGNKIILGLNGKYFIPMVLPFLLLFKGNKPKYNQDFVKVCIFIAICFMLFSSCLSLLHRFYNITPQLYYKI